MIDQLLLRSRFVDPFKYYYCSLFRNCYLCIFRIRIEVKWLYLRKNVVVTRAHLSIICGFIHGLLLKFFIAESFTLTLKYKLEKLPQYWCWPIVISKTEKIWQIRYVKLINWTNVTCSVKAPIKQPVYDQCLIDTTILCITVTKKNKNI